MSQRLSKKLTIVGPMLVDAGYVKTQGEALADLLESAGCEVIRKSRHVNRVLRFLDTVLFLFLRPGKYDTAVIQIYGGFSFFLEDAASWAARWHGKRIIMTLHGGGLPDFFAKNLKWSRRVMKRADAITCPSPFLIEKLRFLGLTPIEIPNLLRLKDYRYRSREHFRPRIFWMRAYHDIYDPRLAISVFEHVCDYYDDAVLTMAGPDMGLMDAIKDMAGKSKYAERIRVLQRVDFEEKQKLADDHDIYLNTNKIDNAPVSMVEMAAWGLALVSTKVGGIPYLFGPGTALLADRNEVVVQKLGEQVISIVKSPEQARAMVSQAYNQVSRFDESLVKSQWLNII